MKAVIQRVAKASVTVDGKRIASIGKGYLVLLGVGQEDDRTVADRIVKKMAALRIFEDENGKTNLSIKDVGGSVLVVSQFTLYADTARGNRPGFTLAAKPDMAEELYLYFVEKCHEAGLPVSHGQFGAHMEVELLNDGPFTIILE